MANLTKVVTLLTSALALLEKGGAETEAASYPTPKAALKLKGDELNAAAERWLGIDPEDMSEKAVKSLLHTAACIKAEEADELDQFTLAALCKAVGVKPAKKLAATVEALSEYLDGLNDTAAEEETSDDTDDEDTDSDDDDEDEKPAKKGKKSSDDDEDEDETSDDDDEDETSDDDEDEKPAKKGKKAASDDDDDEDETSDDDDDDEDEKPAKKGKKSSDDDEDEDEDETSDDDEDAPELDASHVKLFNKVAKKPVKNAEQLTKLLTDDDGNVVAWGTPYVKDENGFCCGLPLKDAPQKGVKSPVGKCQVTGKLFTQNDEDELVPFKAKK